MILIGIISALGASICWTYACFLWRKQTEYFSALQINLIKNVIACLIFSPILFTLDFQSNFREIIILLASGVLGIAIGDSLYITSLKNLGTRKTLTIEASSPILASILGAVMLNEMPSRKVLLGVLIVSLSLIGVAFQKTKSNQELKTNCFRKNEYLVAFLSVLCAVIAANLSRAVLINSNMNPFQTTEIRLIGSLIALLPLVRINLKISIKDLSLINKSKLVYATLLGTNLGIFLQQSVFQLLPIGLGWTLLSTSPVMALFFARAEGEEVNWKTYVLTATTILGVGIVFI